MERIKNIVSFVYPIMVEAIPGKITPLLEVTKYKGKYCLNSKNSNYSFGSLHTIFDLLFKKVNIQNHKFNNALLLGMGAGSIIQLLRNKYNINATITAIEKDSVVIDLASKYFNIDKHSHLKIVNDDAYDFVSKTNEQYDLIIIDLFVDSTVPKIFASLEFLTQLRRIASNASCIIYNKMTEHPVHKKEFMSLAQDFEEFFPNAEIHQFNVNHSENTLLFSNTVPIQNKKGVNDFKYLTNESIRRFGRFVDNLGGKYITAEDVGMTTRDMEYVRMETKTCCWCTGVFGRKW